MQLFKLQAQSTRSILREEVNDEHFLSPDTSAGKLTTPLSPVSLLYKGWAFIFPEWQPQSHKVQDLVAQTLFPLLSW